MEKSVSDPDSMFFKIIDLETNQEIKNCIYADDATGEYTTREIRSCCLTKDKKAKIKIVDIREEANSFKD